MTGCHRIPASLYPRETAPWCLSQPRVLSVGSGWEEIPAATNFAQLVLLPYPPPLSLESSSSINHLPKNPQLRPRFQEHQSKKSISHLTAQTVVLLTNSSHVSPMTPGYSSRPQMTPLTGCSVEKPRLCPCLLSSSHVPDPAETGWDLGTFAGVFAVLAPGHTSPGATEYEVTIRD